MKHKSWRPPGTGTQARGGRVADKIPGAVPALADIATPYDGNVMVPFGADFSLSQSTIIGTLAFVGILSAANAGAANARDELEEEAPAAPPSE